MIPEILQVITQVAMVVFIVGSMAAMGLGLTIPRIVEPLRDVRLVAALLVANFVVVPAAAVAAGRLLPMEPAAASLGSGCGRRARCLERLSYRAIWPASTVAPGTTRGTTIGRDVPLGRREAQWLGLASVPVVWLDLSPEQSRRPRPRSEQDRRHLGRAAAGPPAGVVIQGPVVLPVLGAER